MGRPRQKPPLATPYSTDHSTSVNLDTFLDPDLVTFGLDTFLEPQCTPVPTSLSSAPSLLTPPPAIEPSYASDGNNKTPSVNTPLEYDWNSNYLYRGSSIFQDLPENCLDLGTAASRQRDLKNEYLERLAKLSSNLFKQLNRTDCDQNADAEGHWYEASTTSTSANVTPHGSRYAIGETLQSSQEFLGILKYFLLASAGHQSSPQQVRSEATDSNPHAEAQASQTDEPLQGNKPHYPNSHYQSTSARSPFLPQSLPTSSTFADTLTMPRSPHHLELPTILAIFSCYVALIRVYRGVLTQIYDVLQSSNPPPPIGLPPILPGLSLDGFQLDRHHSLQVNVLTQVSMDLLHRVEKAVAAIAGGHIGKGKGNGNGDGPLGMSGGYTPLLEMVVQQEAPKGLEDEDGGIASLRTLVKQIRKSLEENLCMQLNEADTPL